MAFSNCQCHPQVSIASALDCPAAASDHRLWQQPRLLRNDDDDPGDTCVGKKYHSIERERTSRTVCIRTRQGGRDTGPRKREGRRRPK